MLGPALNLARLDLRAGSPDDALRRLEEADQAVAAGRDLAVDGSMLPVSAISGTSEEHAKLRNIVRALHVGDRVRAHAMAGRWHLAAGLAETLGGVYPGSWKAGRPSSSPGASPESSTTRAASSCRPP
jgi:hypothetical protein